MTFAEKLKNLRKNKGLSQGELAKNFGLTRQVVSKWESGNGLPDIDNLVKIAKFFSVSVDDLLDYKLEQIEVDFGEKIEKLDKNNRGYNALCKYIVSKFVRAEEIYSLSQEINLNIWQEIFYSLFDIDVALGLHDLIQNGIVYSFFIVNGGEKFLAIAKRGTLMTKKLSNDFKKRHLIVDGYRYEKVKRLK